MPKKAIQLKTTNNLPAFLVPYSSIKTVNCVLVGKAGADHDIGFPAGTAHFLEHIVFEATKNYPEASQLEDFASNYGIYANAFTYYTGVKYYAKALKEDFEKCLEFLSELVVNPLIKPDDIAKQKQIIKQELLSDYDSLKATFASKTREWLYKGTRREVDIAGSLHSIDSITAHHLEEFKQKYYTTDNFALAICGNLTKTQAEKAVNKYFGTMPQGGEQFKPQVPIKQGFAIYAQNEQIEQAKILIDFNAVSYNDDFYYPTMYIDYILGENESSRLYRKARTQKGLAYDVGSYYNYKDSRSVFGFQTEIDESSVGEFFQIIKAEIVNITNELLSQDELARVRRNILTSTSYTEEMPMKCATYYANMQIFDTSRRDMAFIYKQLKAVTPEQILQAARRLFSQKPIIMVLSKQLTTDQIGNLWIQA